MAAKKKASKKKKLSIEERQFKKLQSAHRRVVQTMFRNAGFKRVPEIADVEITFQEKSGDFDDAFILENLIVFVEYTASQSSGVTAHLQKKKILFEKVATAPKAFIAHMRSLFPAFNERLGTTFHEDDLRLRILYCSRHDFDINQKKYFQEVCFLDYPELKYFEKLAGTIKYSVRHELLDFLELKSSEVAEKGLFPKDSAEDYSGSILPEKSSGYPSGFKVVSFYADAESLLRRAFVLRRNGWRSTFQAYQRMIQPTKIEAIRKKLRTDKQVFINNLIATLPSDVYPIGANGQTFDFSTLTAITPVKIKLPLRANSVGLVDGQHRLFSYYEEREGDDKQIAILRRQQNLLVTGIIYPPSVSQPERERFEAALFLAINSNQTNAPAALRQEIEVVLSPSSPTAIGKQVMQRLAKEGSLSGHVESYFFDKGKLKTTSIVSYGLGPLIKLTGDDTLFKIFDHQKKQGLIDGTSDAALQDYLQFATSHINILLNAVKINVDEKRWTTDAKVAGRLLTVTYINAFLITLRFLVRDGHKLDFKNLKKRFEGIASFPFKSFHSSQYGRMAERIYDKHFVQG